MGCKEGKRRETACGVVGFNRNILGCKEILLQKVCHLSMRFNRNILGCKVYSPRTIEKNIQDLIETYWDVKDDYIIDHDFEGHRFNRNILGCKGKKKAHKTVGSKKI